MLEHPATRLDRERTANERDAIACRRDLTATARDVRWQERDTKTLAGEATPTQKARADRRRSEAHRATSATDRHAAARDREVSATERAHLEDVIEKAQLDGLTGTFRREWGREAISSEMDRARRGDGRFVLAFVDVDRLKQVNGRDGHAAGDVILQKVASAIRAQVRAYDVIVRQGGDEFLCTLGRTDVPTAESRFRSIGRVVARDAGVGISVGFATLGEGDTVDALTARADTAMRRMKEHHHRAD